MIKIFIAEGVPSQNKGEAAILTGMLETFKIIGDVKVSLLSFYPEIDSVWHDSRVRIVNGLNSLHLVSAPVERSRIVRILESISALLQHILFAVFYKVFGLNATKIMRSEIWKEYCASDLIIVGHDYIFSTTPYGFVLFFSPLYTIFLAKLLKKPVVVYAATIGPFENKLWTILARFFLNKVDLIMLREEISHEYLQKIGVDKPPIFVTADTAFLQEPATPERIKEIMSKENINKDTPMIGMSVTRNMFRYAFPELKKQDKHGEYIKLMARVVDYLSDTLNATIVFIPHALGPGKYDDRIAANEIYRVVKNKHKVRVITNEYTSGELKGVISKFDLFIGERNHSVIGSTSMFVPSVVISIPSDYRVQGIIGKMLGQERWIYNIEMLDYDTLISKISEAWSDKEDTKKELMLRIDTIKEQALLNGRLMKNLLDSLRKDVIK